MLAATRIISSCRSGRAFEEDLCHGLTYTLSHAQCWAGVSQKYRLRAANSHAPYLDAQGEKPTVTANKSKANRLLQIQSTMAHGCVDSNNFQSRTVWSAAKTPTQSASPVSSCPHLRIPMSYVHHLQRLVRYASNSKD